MSEKYSRTYHYLFSKGTTSDDRINHEWWEDITNIDTAIHLSKLDGENNCLSKLGVFARSHVAPTVSPWTLQLRIKWEMIKNDLGDLEIFGENLYAIHSIEYPNIENHYYIFAIRYKDMWLSWEEVKFYAELLDFQTVPELKIIKPASYTKESFQNEVISLSNEIEVFGSKDIYTGKECSREGIVTRNYNEFPIDKFKENVLKIVRKSHVKTDEHWKSNWKRAKLIHEL